MTVVNSPVVKPVAIKPAEGCRLILPEGGMTLDGLGIAPGQDLPEAGAFVMPGVWLRKRLDEGDAVLVDEAAIALGQQAIQVRDSATDTKAPKKLAAKGDGA